MGKRSEIERLNAEVTRLTQANEALRALNTSLSSRNLKLDVELFNVKQELQDILDRYNQGEDEREVYDYDAC